MVAAEKSTSSGGVGFSGLLTLLFVGLKLTDVIAWSWLWVLSPLWIGLALFLAITAIVLLGVGIAALVGSKR